MYDFNVELDDLYPLQRNQERGKKITMSNCDGNI